MTDTTPKNTDITLGLTRKSVEGIKIFACPQCGAPGVYKRDDRIKAGWPGCHDPARHDQPVGHTCPNCGGARDKDKNLGELTASMPRWIWNTVLAFKWCLIKLSELKKSLVTKGARDGSRLHGT